MEPVMPARDVRKVPTRPTKMMVLREGRLGVVVMAGLLEQGGQRTMGPMLLN